MHAKPTSAESQEQTCINRSLCCLTTVLSLRLNWQRHTDLDCYTAFLLMPASHWRETKLGGSIAERCKDTPQKGQGVD